VSSIREPTLCWNRGRSRLYGPRGPPALPHSRRSCPVRTATPRTQKQCAWQFWASWYNLPYRPII
jgi:hypothetical protein